MTYSIVKRIDSVFEKQIVTGLIVSTGFYAGIEKIYKSEYIQSEQARMLCSWCFDYYKEFNKAPKGNIKDIYEKHKQANIISPEVMGVVGKYIAELSESHERVSKYNDDYFVKETKKYFKKRALEIHTETISALNQNGQVDEAQKLAESFQFSILNVNESTFLGNNKKDIKRILKRRGKPLIKYNGPLGYLINSAMLRGGFVYFLAPEKRGKSWVLLELAMKAATQDNKVVFIQAGDMTESEQKERLFQYMAKKPLEDKTVLLPIRDCLKNQLNRCADPHRKCHTGIINDLDDLSKLPFEDAPKDYKPCAYCYALAPEKYEGTHWFIEQKATKLTAEDVLIHQKEFKKEMRYNPRMLTYDNNTLSVKEIRNVLEGWKKKEGYVPDVIVLDYADLLVADTSMEYRHSQNEIWKNLRRISQEYNVLLITSSQADADSYDKANIGRKNFSEDKRKRAHVTAEFALNQTDEERQERIIRIAKLDARDDFSNPKSQVAIMQCLDIGRPYLGSYFAREIVEKKDKKKRRTSDE